MHNYSRAYLARPSASGLRHRVGSCPDPISSIYSVMQALGMGLSRGVVCIPVDKIKLDNMVYGDDARATSQTVTVRTGWVGIWIRVNDPSAGSPTETLLRLLLPLNNKVYITSHGPARLP